jgi:tRNA/tmRNA/rRNA uracil-C5-methylase (TrmA/RlmC/RlmD family)
MNVEISIQKLVFGGSGLGFVDGKAVFVEGALPGEKVLARVVNEKHNYCKARVARILDASPSRMDPPCPYIHACGGCQYQHITYPEELHWKEEQVHESFTQALHLDPSLIARMRSGEKEYGYRTSITLHRSRKENNKPQRLGFIGRDNRSMVMIDNCMIADSALKSVFTSEFKLDRNEEKRVFKVTDKKEIVSSDAEINYQVRVNGIPLWTNSMGFFQNNLEVTEMITQQVATWVGEIKPARFLDLCSGVGTFSILTAGPRISESRPGPEAVPDVPEIFCFEENPYSIACLKRNFRELNIPLRQAVTGRVEKTFPSFILNNHKEGTLIFLDPPRQGIDPQLSRLLAHEQGIDNIIYLACDLQILIRDLKILLSNGRYEIKAVIPFDMFPRTKHIEVLVRLARLKA